MKQWAILKSGEAVGTDHVPQNADTMSILPIPTRGDTVIVVSKGSWRRHRDSVGVYRGELRTYGKLVFRVKDFDYGGNNPTRGLPIFPDGPEYRDVVQRYAQWLADQATAYEMEKATTMRDTAIERLEFLVKTGIVVKWTYG